MTILEKAQAAKKAFLSLSTSDIKRRNRILEVVAENLDKNRKKILHENSKDLSQAEADNLPKALFKRLVVNAQKLDSMIENVASVRALPDPLGKVLIRRELDNGLILEKVRVPLGVLGVIFESRPDALVQIGSLSIKSANAVILKGGREALHSNEVLFAIIRSSISAVAREYTHAVELLATREDVQELLALDQYIDLMIPRGSNELVRYIKENTRVPVLGHSDGICHVYIDKDADVKSAVRLTYDSKCQYPAVCNAVETLLVHREIAEDFLPKLQKRLKGVELRADAQVRQIIQALPATEKDWETEYNDLVLSIKIVGSTEEAVDHINTFGSHHTDAIVTRNEETAEVFLKQVDSSSVMWNASTRFADRYRYGLGAEVGISTNKLHARGPVGLEGLTTYKYILRGNDAIVADYADGLKTFTHKILS